MNDDQLARMLPKARRIDYDHGDYCVYVFPFGLKHMRLFTEALGRLFEAIATTKVKKGVNEKELYGAMAAVALPHLMGDLLGLVAATTIICKDDVESRKPKLIETQMDELPHWELPPIIEAWIDLNLGEEEKRRPWIRAIENAVARITNKPFSMSEFLSKDSSLQDTDSTISSNVDSEPKKALSSPTGDGAGSS